MNNIVLLVKNYFRIFLSRIARLFTKKSKSAVSVAGIMVVFSGIFILMFAMISYSTIDLAIKSNNPAIALYSFATTLVMFTLMLIVTESSPSKKTTDEDFLLSLPFKKSEIVAAKVIYFCLFDFVILLGLIFPSYILYYVLVEGTTIWFLIKSFLVILFSTLFATGVAGILSTIINKATKRLKYSNIIQSLLSVTLIIVFIIIYIGFTMISQNPKYASEIYNLYPVRLIAETLYKPELTNLIIVTIISLSTFIVSVLFKTYFYGKNISTYQSDKQTLEYKESSVQKSLYKRELGKYFSIPIYVSNTSMGALLSIMLALIVGIVGKDFFLNILEVLMSTGYEGYEVPTGMMSTIDKFFNFGVIMLMSISIAMAPTTSSAISIENKELWILKAHPISYKDVFISKIKVNLTITVIPIIFSSFILAFNLGFKYWIFILLIPSLVSIMSSAIGLYSNLLLPKFGWESEQEVVKQGSAVAVSMLFGSICTIVPAALYFILPINSEIILMSIITVVYLLMAIIWNVLLFTHGKQLYEKL